MNPTRRNFLLASAAAVAAAPAAPAEPAPRPGKWQPKLSENLADVNADTLRWLAQLGCKHVVFQGTDGVDADKEGFWAPGDVRVAKKACEEAGLVLESMMIPIDFYRQARLGQPGRDRRSTTSAAPSAPPPTRACRFWSGASGPTSSGTSASATTTSRAAAAPG